MQEQPQPVPSKRNTPSRRNRFAAIGIIVLLCGAAGFLGGLVGGSLNGDGNEAASFDTVKDDGNLIVTENEQDIASLVQKVSPSVVSIVTTVESAGFGGQTGQAAGTGMIVSKDGYVMTNKHVIDDASSVTVITSNGKTYQDVSVLGSDPLNDVAFLKIKGVKNLPAVTLGDSKTVRTGQQVVAIGNALGQYQNTVTTGIISGLGRPVIAGDETGANAESLSDLLQTDAAINQGNSGGPLLNLQGQVIGINTAVAQDAQSIGFAIPIGATKGMLKHLIETGKLKRAIIGVQYVSITPEVKAEYDLPVSSGDYITAGSGRAVQPGSPAAKAGLKAKDIITKVNGQSVGPGKSVSTLIGEFRPGDTVTLTILRDGKSSTVEVTLAAY